MRNLSHALPFFQLTFLQNLPVLFTLLSSGSYLLYFVQILHFLGGKVGSVHILFCPFRFCLHLDGRVTMICWWIKSESVLGGLEIAPRFWALQVKGWGCQLQKWGDRKYKKLYM